MWIILLFLCFSVILRNNAQDLTSYEAQTSTQTSYTNSDVEWNSSRPPVSLSIRNGRNENKNQAVTSNSELPLIYTNVWEPKITRIPANRNRDTNSYVSENEHSVYHQLATTIIRRPDLETNNTVPSKLTEREQFSGIPVPILYFQSNLTSESDGDQIYSETLSSDSLSVNSRNFQPFDLYRNAQNFIPARIPSYYTPHFSLNSNTESLKTNVDLKDEELKSTNSDSVTSETNEEIIKALPAEDRPIEQVFSVPMDNYRDQRIFPPMLPTYFPPYAFIPFQRDNTFHPMIPYIPNDQTFNRKAGSEFYERVQESPEKEILPRGPADLGRLAENIPSETSTVIPSEPSFPGYPFRYLLPPYTLPLIPNFPQSGLPLSHLPLTQPRKVQEETIIAGTLQAPSIAPEVLLENDKFIPEKQTSVVTEPEGVTEGIVPVEEPEPTKTPYAFGFESMDNQGNGQHRNEVSDNSGAVTGSYGYSIGGEGRYRFVRYIADKFGFRVFIQSNEPGVANSGSADVMVMAERPPSKAIVEATKEVESEIIAVPDVNADLIAPGSILEPK